MSTSSPQINVSLRISKQWSGAFEGEISLINSGPAAISQWSVSFRSRHALAMVSNFSLQQSRLADGSWLITLSPPRWGATLLPNRVSRSYLQGVLPAGSRLASLSEAALLLPPATPAAASGTTSDNTAPPPLLAGSGTGSNSGAGGGGSADSNLPGSNDTAALPAPATPLPAGGRNSGNSADALWGEQFFAPYVDMGLYPVPDLDGLARHHGVGLFTLGFIQATAAGEAAWAGLPALSLTGSHPQALDIRREISQLRAAGGDVMVSFGGAAGTSLAQKLAAGGAGAGALADRYRQVVDSLALNRIDFDIEGAALRNRAANQLLAEALRLLQQSHPGLEIWFTLPVLPQGLTAEGLAVVRQALAAGVGLDGVNLMTMNYGDGAAPAARQSMGQYAIDAAEASFRQLSTLHGSFGRGFRWNQLGITPMIGLNDVRSEVFSTADARLVEDFARQRGLGMLSMWSIARDNPGPAGQLANTHNGTTAPAGSFSAIWGDFGSDPLISGGLPGAGGGVPGGGSAAGTTGDSATTAASLVAVAADSTVLVAGAGQAERFRLGYAWGRQLTINGFDPGQDVLDLRGFWAEGQQARVVATAEGARVLLDFNAQVVLLPGVTPNDLNGTALQIWQG